MNDKETRSKNIARILGRTAVSTDTMPIDRIIPTFDEAEAKCLALEPSEELKLEIKRRVAEWKMRLFCERNASPKEVEKLHDTVVALGYTNLEREGDIETLLAVYYEQRGQIRESCRILNMLFTKMKSEDPNLHDLFVNTKVKSLLARINTSGN